jgi:peptidoglycan hydrolase CwlO-like protein
MAFSANKHREHYLSYLTSLPTELHSIILGILLMISLCLSSPVLHHAIASSDQAWPGPVAMQGRNGYPARGVGASEDQQLVLPHGPPHNNDEMNDLQQEIQSMESQLKQLHQEEMELQNREKQLSESIRHLKEESKKSQGLLLDIRIEASLRDFRDLLLSIKKVEAQEHELEEQLTTKRARLREVLSRKVDEQVKIAQDLYRKGQEKEADEAYLQGLSLMEDYKKLSKIEINEESIPILTDPLELPPLSKAEPEQLTELADLLLDDAELMAKEVTRYTEIHKRLLQEKRLLDQLMGFQGVIERGQPASNHRAQEIHRERQDLERKIRIISQKISVYQERERILTKRARQLQEIAEGKKQAPGPDKDKER